MPDSFKHLSRYITDGPDRAPARAMLKAVGFTNEDLARPLVGVAHSWIEVMPCTLNARDLAEHVKAGIRAAGGTPIEYNTIAISDGVSMGTEGMKASLISRELIADSIELVARGHLFDAVVAISGCDKTIPAAVMGLARLNIPSLMLYGGSIMPGRFQGRDVTIQDVFEGVGAYAAGKMTAAELDDLESHACPGAGACGGQFTANTMAIAFEMLGISPMGSASVPATDDARRGLAGDPIDRDYLARFTLCNAALEREVLELFAAQAPVYLERLRAARDCVAWRNAAHTIKGSASAVGAWRLAHFAQMAEQIELEGDPALAAEHRDEAIAVVAISIDEACRFIGHLFHQAADPCSATGCPDRRA